MKCVFVDCGGKLVPCIGALASELFSLDVEDEGNGNHQTSDETEQTGGPVVTPVLVHLSSEEREG